MDRASRVDLGLSCFSGVAESPQKAARFEALALGGAARVAVVAAGLGRCQELK